MVKLDIGCGPNKHLGYIGIDKRGLPGVDIVLDLDKEGLPFPDNSVDEVLLYHVLEHVESPWKVMKEVIRVCKDGAIIRVRFPYPLHENAYKDPEHKYILVPLWFRLFKELEIVRVEKHYPSPILGRFCEHFCAPQVRKHWPDEYRITLRVRKGRGV
jgi:ubiquinone/menaquinone biosynthesis C-methylase UbiE